MEPDQPAPPAQDVFHQGGGARYGLQRSLVALKRRLVAEATAAVQMLEDAIEALWALDHTAAREVRQADDNIDREEVAIEAECIRLLTMQQPVAGDMRRITFIMKVNSEIERVADHATSIAKTTSRISKLGTRPAWPTALREMGERVPIMCHNLLRAVLDEDAQGARSVIADDDVIDRLERQLFEEATSLMELDEMDPATGLYIHRLGREFERAADAMTNIAEDLLYLTTGQIMRHAHEEEPPSDRMPS
ncbi:MAG: phosphate signaling complex protein PhoU [Phycisphaerales bacterium JB039]